MSRMFYIAVTQQVILFGAESWVLTGKMEAALDAFQGRVARRLTGRTPRRGGDEKWFCLPLVGATQATGIVRVRTSVLRRQNTVAQFVATRPISGPLRGIGATGGDTGPPTLVGAEGTGIGPGEREGERRGDGGDGKRRHGVGRNNGAGGGSGSNNDGISHGSGEVDGGGGVTGSQWLQWGGVERGGDGVKSEKTD